MSAAINFGNEKFVRLSIPLSAIRRATDEEIAQISALKALADAPPELPPGVKADNHPSNLYATIQKNGRTIASLYIGGSMATPNDVALPDNLSLDGQGPTLADQRIRQMLALHGGTVVYTQDVQARNAAAQTASLFAAQLAGQASA